MNFLKDLGPKHRTPDEKAELERLEARYPEVPFDPTRARVLAAEFVRRMIIRRGLPPGSRSEKTALKLTPARQSGQGCGTRLIRTWSILVLIGSPPVAGTPGIEKANVGACNRPGRGRKRRDVDAFRYAPQCFRV